MRDGAIVANAGHFDVEIDLVQLEAMAEDRRRTVRPMVEEFTVISPDGRAAGGSGFSRKAALVNLSAAEGHPAAVMESLVRQPRARGRMAGSRPLASCPNRVHGVPLLSTARCAKLKLETMGTVIDEAH